MVISHQLSDRHGFQDLEFGKIGPRPKLALHSHVSNISRSNAISEHNLFTHPTADLYIHSHIRTYYTYIMYAFARWTFEMHPYPNCYLWNFPTILSRSPKRIPRRILAPNFKSSVKLKYICSIHTCVVCFCESFRLTRDMIIEISDWIIIII